MGQQNSWLDNFYCISMIYYLHRSRLDKFQGISKMKSHQTELKGRIKHKFVMLSLHIIQKSKY